MQKITRKLVTTGTWEASAALTPVDLPREGLITEIGIRAHMTIADTTFAALRQPDGLRRILEAIRIEGDGGHAYLGLEAEQMSRILSLWNTYEFNCGMTSFLDTDAEDILFVFHPGSNPKDPFDMSAVIPARALSTLQAKLTTGICDIIDDVGAGTNEITAGTFYYYIHEVLDVPTPAGIMTPLGTAKKINYGTTTYSAYSLEDDVPTGAWLRRIFILVQDAGSTGYDLLRKDDEVTQIKLKLPKAAMAQIELEWLDLKMDCAKTAGVSCVPLQGVDAEVENMCIPDGWAIIDLRKYFHPLYGANLTGYQAGDVKLGMTTVGATAGDDIILYYDQLQPVEAQYVGR